MVSIVNHNLKFTLCSPPPKWTDKLITDFGRTRRSGDEPWLFFCDEKLSNDGYANKMKMKKVGSKNIYAQTKERIQLNNGLSHTSKKKPIFSTFAKW